MSAPFDPDQAGGGLPGDEQPDTDRPGTDHLEADAGEAAGALEDHGADVGPDSGDPSGSPVSHEHDDEDEAGGGPVFRRPQPGDRLHPDDLATD